MARCLSTLSHGHVGHIRAIVAGKQTTSLANPVDPATLTAVRRGKAILPQPQTSHNSPFAYNSANRLRPSYCQASGRCQWVLNGLRIDRLLLRPTPWPVSHRPLPLAPSWAASSLRRWEQCRHPGFPYLRGVPGLPSTLETRRLVPDMVAGRARIFSAGAVGGLLRGRPRPFHDRWTVSQEEHDIRRDP